MNSPEKIVHFVFFEPMHPSMTRFWKFVYSAFTLPLMWIGIHALGIFHPKVRRGLRGRRNMLVRMEERLRHLPEEKRLWIHASSMGEFEQAKPIIEAIKARVPDALVIATFFSPSGYENNLRYPHADYISYLPIDTRRAVRRFLDIANPALTAFIRYDLWPNAIWECDRRGIPILLTNATMSRGSARRWPVVRSFHRAMYNALRSILTVSPADAEQFAVYRLSKPEILAIGDTRYDRVKGRAEAMRGKKLIPDAIARGKKILVVGSSWNEDEEMVLPAVFRLQRAMPELLCILVPHEPTLEHLEQLEFNLRGRSRSIRFSYLPDYTDEQVIIIDSIGILLALYAYAHVAFVGGGFRTNVHNVLEPSVYGIPVLYGPKIENSQEAAELEQAGGGFIVRKKPEIYRRLRTLFLNETARREAGARAAEFVHSRTGATEKILEHMLPFLEENEELGITN